MTPLVVVLFNCSNKKIYQEKKETKITMMIVAVIVKNMKYVINIKRKPSIIKKRKREEKNTFI